MESGIEGGRGFVSEVARDPTTALHGGREFCESGQNFADASGDQDAGWRAEFQPAFVAGISGFLDPDLRLEVRAQSVLIRG